MIFSVLVVEYTLFVLKENMVSFTGKNSFNTIRKKIGNPFSSTGQNSDPSNHAVDSELGKKPIDDSKQAPEKKITPHEVLDNICSATNWQCETAKVCSSYSLFKCFMSTIDKTIPLESTADLAMSYSVDYEGTPDGFLEIKQWEMLADQSSSLLSEASGSKEVPDEVVKALLHENRIISDAISIQTNLDEQRGAEVGERIAYFQTNLGKKFWRKVGEVVIGREHSYAYEDCEKKLKKSQLEAEERLRQFAPKK